MVEDGPRMLLPGDIITFHVEHEGDPVFDANGEKYFIDGTKINLLVLSDEDVEAIMKGEKSLS